MPVPQAIQSLAEQSALWSDNHGVTLRNIAALLSNAPCYRLIRHHGDTGADLTLTTSSETYYPGVLTFSTELLAPKIRTNTTVTDLNGGNVEPGDTAEPGITH